jgi:outer membrane protein assembly factor BamA
LPVAATRSVSNSIPPLQPHHCVSQTNPYYTDDGISRGYEVYLRTTEPPALNIGSYKIKQTGGRVSFGVPFSEVDTVFFGIGASVRASDRYHQPDALQAVRDRQRRPVHRCRFGHHQRHAADGVGSATAATR